MTAPAAEIHIRSARIADAEALVAAERAFAATAGFLVSRPDELQLAAFRTKIAALASGEDGRYVVAERADVVVGHAVLEAMGLAALAHVARLTIVVHPGHQGRGIGRALLGELIAWAQAAPHIEKIELLVRASNQRAIALYRHMGFVEEGRFVRRIKVDGGRYIDDIAMALFTKPQR